jgi:uncharacterized protein (DUF169 family)
VLPCCCKEDEIKRVLLERTSEQHQDGEAHTSLVHHSSHCADDADSVAVADVVASGGESGSRQLTRC